MAFELAAFKSYAYDFDGPSLRLPDLVHDLLAGARRLIQRARGYQATIVSGQVTFEDGEPIGAPPGRLLRDAQAALGVSCALVLVSRASPGYPPRPTG